MSEPDAQPLHIPDELVNAIVATIRDAFAETPRRDPDPLRLLSVSEVADRLSVSEDTVEREIADGRLVPVWVRRQRRFDPRAVDAYVRESARLTGKPTRSKRVATKARAKR